MAREGISNATRMLRERYRRARFFPHVAEPAWLILLDLYANPGRDVSVTSACLASFAPATTALRYIDLLEANGLVQREADATDRRRINLRLTAAATDAFADFFAEPRAPTQPLQAPRGTLAGSAPPAPGHFLNDAGHRRSDSDGLAPAFPFHDQTDSGEMQRDPA